MTWLRMEVERDLTNSLATGLVNPCDVLVFLEISVEIRETREKVGWDDTAVAEVGRRTRCGYGCW
jgi:hypothetical protein